VVRAHPRYADLPPASCPALRRTGRWPDLSSASPTAPPGPGDTTPQVIRSTGGHSHAGPGGQRPRCGTAENITGGRPPRGPWSCVRPSRPQRPGSVGEGRRHLPGLEPLQGHVAVGTDTDAYGLVRAGGVDAGGQGTPVGEDLQCGVVDKDAQVDPPVGARRDLSVPGFSVGRRVEAAG